MKSRIRKEDTPEGRLAAVVKTIIENMRIARNDLRFDPDQVDLREGLRPFVERELLIARITEMLLPAASFSTRMASLTDELRVIEEQMDIT